MKLSTSLIVVALTLGVAFSIYSSYPTPNAETLEANIVESTTPQEPDEPTVSEDKPVKAKVEVTSTEGLDEELTSILQGYEDIQDNFERLEPPKTATGAGN